MGWQINSSNDTKYVAFCLMARRLDDLADVSTVPQSIISIFIPHYFRVHRSMSNVRSLIISTRDGKIDILLNKKRTLIERLKEKRTAVISRTVTRGLPPEAARAAASTRIQLKPSEVEWLGDIPEHWEVKKLSWLFRYSKGPNAAILTKEYVGSNPGEFPVYSGQTEHDGLME